MLKHLSKALFSTFTGVKRLPNRTFAEQLMCNTLKSLMQGGKGKGVDHLRQQMDSLNAPSSATKRVEISKNELAGLDCLFVEPKTGADKNRMILFLHGGGYIIGSPEGYKALIAEVSVSANCLVIAPDYRLAPEAVFPAPQTDCLAVAQACVAEYQGRLLSIVGDSAGGGLAIATTLSLIEEAAPQQAPVDSLVLISPWVDPLAEGGSMIANADHDFLTAPFLQKGFEALMQGQDQHDPRVNFSEADLSSLPRTLVQYGTGELFCDQIQAFVQRAKAQGADIQAQPYADQCHDFQFFTAVSGTARTAVLRIGEFINRGES